jgi:hypothetical protein
MTVFVLKKKFILNQLTNHTDERLKLNVSQAKKKKKKSQNVKAHPLLVYIFLSALLFC